MKPVIIDVPEGCRVRVINKKEDCSSKLCPDIVVYCEMTVSSVSQWRLSFRERISAFLFGSVYVGIIPDSKGTMPMHWAIASRHFIIKHSKIEILWDKFKRFMNWNV